MKKTNLDGKNYELLLWLTKDIFASLPKEITNVEHLVCLWLLVVYVERNS